MIHITVTEITSGDNHSCHNEIHQMLSHSTIRPSLITNLTYIYITTELTSLYALGQGLSNKLNFDLIAWCMLISVYLSMWFIRNMNHTASIAGHWKNKEHSQISWHQCKMVQWKWSRVNSTECNMKKTKMSVRWCHITKSKCCVVFSLATIYDLI